MYFSISWGLNPRILSMKVVNNFSSTSLEEEGEALSC
jgi:hypothetical protein